MIEHILNVVTAASIFFIVSVGLLIVMGVMRVVNLAHGAFLTVGGYAAVVVSNNGWNPWFSLPLAIAVGFIIGMLTEIFLVRKLYGRPLDTILATWGLSIVIIQIIADQFGRSGHFVTAPMSVEPLVIFGTYYSRYRLFMVLVALVIAWLLVIIARYTNVGTIARAVIMNPELAKSLGIHTGRVNVFSFAIGSALASFCGALIVPMSSVDPNLGTPWVITAFMVVLASGISLPALVLSSLFLAAGQILATFYIAPVVGSLVVVAIPVLLMRFVPEGLAGLMRPPR